MGFEIGQRVKVTGSKDELELYSAECGYGLTGTVIEIDDDTDGIRVKPEEGSMLSIWYKPRHLELIPDDGKRSAQYPPLRVMLTDSQPTQTWQQVLDSKPLAAQQPHLYINGNYETCYSSDLQTHENYLVIASHSRDGSFIIFVINEGV
jgi:hypothetical protein